MDAGVVGVSEASSDVGCVCVEDAAALAEELLGRIEMSVNSSKPSMERSAS
jgi:hypothetical protein